MDQRDSEKAGWEARQEVTEPVRPARHSEAALRYLQQIWYAESHRRRTRAVPKHDDRSGDETG